MVLRGYWCVWIIFTLIMHVFRFYSLVRPIISSLLTIFQFSNMNLETFFVPNTLSFNLHIGQQWFVGNGILFMYNIYPISMASNSKWVIKILQPFQFQIISVDFSYYKEKFKGEHFLFIEKTNPWGVLIIFIQQKGWFYW